MSKDFIASQNIMDGLQWNIDGLMPVIVQDVCTKEVIMFAWMNAQSLELTLSKGEAVYYSRSRKKLWHKGEDSGHTQKITSIQLDCDGDCLLIQVEPKGGIACHTGRASCFFWQYDAIKKQWCKTS
jgi:phosphoribosyl-AMP cyclohydrolase